MATPTFGADTEAVQTAGSSIVLPVPTHAEGDLLVAVIRSQQNNSSTDLSSAGWTRIGPAFVASSNDYRIIGFWAKVAGASEPSSYTFAGQTSSTRIVGKMLVLPKVGGVTPAVDAISSTYGGAPTGLISRTSLVTTRPDTLILALHGNEVISPNSSTPTGTPSGWTQRGLVPSAAGTTGTRTTLWLGSKVQTDAGSSGNIDVTWASVSGPAAQAVAFYIPEPSEPTSLEVEVTDGEGGSDPAQVWFYDGEDKIAVTQIMTIPPGLRAFTVSEMEAMIADDETVYWAHRGGSADWPEMTMRAYTNAVWRGARALEISVHRSSDGVWIMSHDANLTRVTATDHVISSTASGTLLGVPVDTPTTGGVIGRLEDVLETYPDLLLIVDNKPNAQISTFLNLLKTVPNWQEHVIVKFDGQYGKATGEAAKAAGFKTCAYLYANNYAAHLDSIDPYTDYHGMEHGADQTVWDAVLAKGKPVWGHVCQTLTQANAAISKGASIVQCAGVKAIIPALNTV